MKHTYKLRGQDWEIAVEWLAERGIGMVLHKGGIDVRLADDLTPDEADQALRREIAKVKRERRRARRRRAA